MRVCIFQPAYPKNAANAEKEVGLYIRQLKNAEKSDLIILPECSNCPGISDRAELLRTIAATTEPLLNAASTAARANCALVSVGVIAGEDGRYVNTNYLFNKDGRLARIFPKVHLTEFEKNDWRLTAPNASDFDFKPFVSDGIGYAAITCYDIYFPEYVQRVGINSDVILHPSYQRSENCGNIVAMCRTRAFDTGCLFIHSSFSMGRYSKTGGHSLIAAPDGRILFDAEQSAGVFYADIPDFTPYMRPSGFGGETVNYKLLRRKASRPDIYRKMADSDAVENGEVIKNSERNLYSEDL
jgi:predicted amidohydrolase